MYNCNCKGVCRCQYKYVLCATVGVDNTLIIPCPFDTDGCLAEVESSRIEVRCPCCNHLVAEADDTVTVSICNDCTVGIDLTGVNCENVSCDLRYRIFINGTPYLAGTFRLDWSFV